MFRQNGLMNSRCFLPLVAVTLLVVAGCSKSDSGNFVKFEDLKKNSTAETAVKDEAKTSELAENLTSSSSNSKTIEARKLLPVVATIPQEIGIANQNNLLKPDVSATHEIKLLVKNRQFNKEGNALRISYDDIDLLKVLNMEPVPRDAIDHFPDWLTQLDGKRIRVRGFMIPHHLESGIKMFVLARDNDICCFGRSPKIYDLIEVRLRSGKPTRYIQGRPFDVVGTLHFDVDYDAEDNMFYRLYTITDGLVIEK